MSSMDSNAGAARAPPQDESTPLLADLHTPVPNLDADIEATQSLLDTKSHEVKDLSTWKGEAWLLCSYAAPLIGTYLLQYFYSVVTIFVAGHIGPESLAAAAIGVTTSTIIGFAIFEGMATALDTLCAQAFGSGNLKGVGLHMQKMIVLMALTAIPIGAIWIFSPYFLVHLVPQPELAVKAGDFLRVSVIGMPGYAIFEAGKRFVQAQGDFTSSLIVIAVCAPINILLNWLFVFKLGWGLKGAALAQALTNDLRPIFLLAYLLIFGRWTFQCWGGFSRNIFKNWGPMVKLSFAGSAVNLCEWGSFEIITLSTAYVSTYHMAAQTVLTTISIVIWHIPFSIGVAVSTRMGHLIGAGAVTTARKVALFYAAVFILNGLIDMSMLFILRNHIIQFFSKDETVIRIARRTIPLVAVFQVGDAFLAGCSGILRGLGRQDVMFWIVFLGNYFWCVPFALFLELGPAKLELVGVWTSLVSTTFAIAFLEVGAMKLISWQKCADEAQKREQDHVD